MIHTNDQVDAVSVGHLYDGVGVRPVKDALARALDVAPAKVDFGPAKAGLAHDLQVAAAYFWAPPGGISAFHTRASSFAMALPQVWGDSGVAVPGSAVGSGVTVAATSPLTGVLVGSAAVGSVTVVSVGATVGVADGAAC